LINLDLERIRTKYPDIENKIVKKIEINSKAWTKLKKRYILTCIIIKNILKMTEKVGDNNNEIKKSAIPVFYNMFTDKETDVHKLVTKYTEKRTGFWNYVWDYIPFTTSKINYTDYESNEISKNMSDIIFLQDLQERNFGKDNEIKQKIISIFFEEYRKWRKVTFPSNVKEIQPKVSYNKELSDKLKEEFEREKREIENREFERIRGIIEEKYKDG